MSWNDLQTIAIDEPISTDPPDDPPPGGGGKQGIGGEAGDE